ncbi:MAG TPA: DUF5685 family protein, partial [Streptosporangiaceae bacterium]
DHVSDGDGAYARRMVASGAGIAAGRWQAAGERAGSEVGFDTTVLTAAIGRQAEIERSSGLALLEVTEPTETAVSAAFAHTAVLAGQPANVGPLATAGRHFGRIAHLLDAVEDVADDREAGAYNPLLATATTPATARERCAEAVDGLRLAVAGLELPQPALAESLLVREVGIAVDKVFAQLERDGIAAFGGWPAQSARRGLASVGLPCLPGNAVRCGRRRPADDDACGACCCDCCCDGCCEGCGECDCGDCSC